MVIFFVNPRAEAEEEESVKRHQQVKPHRRDCPVNDHLAEVADEKVDGVDEKQILHRLRKGINGVEYCGNVHQKLGEHAPKVLHITEKHMQRRQHQPHTEVEYQQHEHRVDERGELPRESDAVEKAEHKKHHERQQEVNKGLASARKDEKVLRHIDFGEYGGIVQQRKHALRGRFVEKREYDIAAEKVSRVMLNRSAEKVSEHHAHYEQCQQRVQNAPRHAERRALVLGDKVAPYQLFQ